VYVTAKHACTLCNVALHEVTQHGARLCGVWGLEACIKLQALVQDILPSATAIGDYAIGLAKEKFFDDAEMAVSL